MNTVESKAEGCAKCGRTDKWMVGYNVVDKSTGEKRIAAICFACLATLADRRGEDERI